MSEPYRTQPKRTKYMILWLVLTASLTVSSSAQKCSDYNYISGPFHYGNLGVVEHSTGSHSWAAVFGGYCHYAGANANVPCSMAGGATVTAAVADTGKLTPVLVLDHEGRTSTKGGVGYSNGSSLTIDAEAAVAVKSCPFWGCGTAPTITGSGLGGGFSVTFPPSAIFDDAQHETVVCTGPEFPQGGGGGCIQPPSGGKASPFISKCGPSPIVISTKRGVDTRKSFTDPKKACVTFNLKNDGRPACYSWPVRGSGVALLVYDRDNDGGVIDSGAELFGDFTPHADGGVKGHPNPNGFLALAWYDDPKQGGNMDLEITSKDAIWKNLRLWFPDHCWDAPSLPCASIPSELHSLESEGIHSLALLYSVSHDGDQWGNYFKFSAQVNPRPHQLQKPDDELNERRAWDVFLAAKP